MAKVVDLEKVQSVTHELLCFQIKRHITGIFKKYLEMTEDQKRQHDEMLLKISAELTEEQKRLVKMADYFTPKRFEDIRKIVLDTGNNGIIELVNLLDKFEVFLNGNRKD